MKDHPLHWKPLIVGIGLIALLFALEIYTRILVGTVSYVFIGLCVLWLLRTPRFLLVFGIASSLFISIGFILLFSEIEHYPTIIINRTLALTVIWLAVYFLFRFNKLDEEQRIKTKQLNALYENANEGILFADGKGQIILTNPFLENMFGYEAAELLNKDIQMLIPGKFFSEYAPKLMKFVDEPEERAKGLDLWAMHKNGQEFPVEITLSHFYNQDQLIVIAFISDATEKKKHQQLVEDNLKSIKHHNLELEEKVRQRTLELQQTNQELEKSQYLYKAMAHNFPDGIIGVLDKNMEYLLVDGKDLRLLNKPEDNESADQFLQEIHALITRNEDAALKRVYKGECVSFDIELQEKVYNVVAVPIYASSNDSAMLMPTGALEKTSDGVFFPTTKGLNSSEAINEILVVVKNVTTQKKLENDLIKMLEKEKELNLLKTRFVTLASHEFRSPLTTILSSAFLLEHYTGEKLEKARKKHLDRIKRSVHGLTEILNDFLSLGKLEEGKIQVAYHEIDLQQFIADLLHEVALLKKDDQKIEFKYEGSPAPVMADKQLLRNILMNLISNAIKYSPVSGHIQLMVSVIRPEIIINISDQGIGIPAEEQKYIFTRFFRAQNASDIQGTGLGLNIVKKYVRLLNGSIDFTSILDQGTTFRVQLPLVSSQQHTELTKTFIPTKALKK